MKAMEEYEGIYGQVLRCKMKNKTEGNSRYIFCTKLSATKSFQKKRLNFPQKIGTAEK